MALTEEQETDEQDTGEMEPVIDSNYGDYHPPTQEEIEAQIEFEKAETEQRESKSRMERLNIARKKVLLRQIYGQASD